MDLYDLTLTKTATPTAQIEAHLRALIEQGKLMPGAKMLSVRQMARRWNTHIATVHQAVDRLAARSLLISRPRSGLFVCRPEERLTSAAVYVCSDIWRAPWAGYARALYLSLAATMELRGVQTRLVIDPRPYPEQARPFPELVRLVKAGEVQAVFMTAAPTPILRWVARLPVARAVVTASQKTPHRVEFDAGQFIALALEYLKSRGCRSVGCLTGSRMAPLSRWNSARDEGHRFFRLWVRKARELGLELRGEWHRGSKIALWRSGLQNQLGYDQFMALWRLKNRPEGLVVLPDSIAPGAIMAMQACQVKVPRQLNVVFQQNEEVALFCPMPVARVVCRVADVATALIEQVYRQLRGEPDQVQRVGYGLKLPENKPRP